jgi:L-malate glycosyltransferase
VFGANMAVRKAIFDLGYRFDPTIGPRGTCAQGSEAELTQRLARADYRAWFCSEAVIEHLISPDHLTEEWILKRARRYGRGRIRRDAAVSQRWAIMGLDVPAPLAFHLVVQAVRIILAWARRDRAALFTARWAWNYLLGQSQEVRGYAGSTRLARQNASTSDPPA